MKDRDEECNCRVDKQDDERMILRYTVVQHVKDVNHGECTILLSTGAWYPQSTIVLHIKPEAEVTSIVSKLRHIALLRCDTIISIRP